jgi:outer membrane protein OmpA-like peptidoglycan-associated protein/tetratricopeptide (TPR) repeat protein
MRTCLLVLLLLFSSHGIFAAPGLNDSGKLQKKADKNFDAGNFDAALTFYLSIPEPDPLTCYKIGVCYFNSARDQLKGIDFFDCYLSHSDSLNTAHFYMARLLHLSSKFEEAITHYKRFNELMQEDPELEDQGMRADLDAMVSRYVLNCNYGKMMTAMPREVVVDNLGPDANSEYREYSPVVDAEESKIYYATRRPEDVEEKLLTDGRFREKIMEVDILGGSLYAPSAEDDSLAGATGYYSMLTDIQLSQPNLLPEIINSQDHNAPIQLAHGSNRLFFYRDFNVWFSDRIDDAGWSEPERFPLDQVNSKAFEPSIFVSYDELSVFVVSERPGGYGGLDIYRMDKSEDGSWTELYNLGPKINTPFNEDAPYFDPDGQTLYFSSTGHTSMGGFDVFRCQFSDTIAGDPVNMGHPVNTPGDDIYYVMTSKYNRAYYASDVAGGYGELDLYRLTFVNERDPVAELKGIVLDGEKLTPLGCTIIVLDHDAEEVANYNNDPLTGEYLLLLGHGSFYDMLVETTGFVPYIRRLEIPEQKKYHRLYQELHQVHLRDQNGAIVGQVVMLFNNFSEDEVIPVDSLHEYYDTATGVYADYLRKITANQSGVVYTEVTYYLSKEALEEATANDTVIQVDFPSSTKIRYYQPVEGSSDKDDPLNYVAFLKKAKDPRTKGVLVNDLRSSSEIASLLDPFENGGLMPVLLFDYDESVVNAMAAEEIVKLINFIKDNPYLQFQVVGHTDANGTAVYNRKLSVGRAREVVEYLISQGVSPRRLEAVGLGEEYPVSTNLVNGVDDPEGRRRNRRVEFLIVDE